MANTTQIKCINRTERMNPHERISHVGGYDGSQWKLTLNDAIGKIESGESAFVVRALSGNRLEADRKAKKRPK